MATTDTRSGFRLPWSSDRNHDTPDVETTAAAAGEAAEEAAQVAPAGWPSGIVEDPGTPAAGPAPVDGPTTETPTTQTAAPVAEESVMLDLQPSPARPAAAPRRPTKLMADLSAAIRSTAESARDQALVQLETDASQVVETIRSSSKEGEAALRARSDEDIAGIKEWSRAEIARIKEETERRIDARKLGLDEELAAHVTAIEQRVGAVESTVAAYRGEMDAYAERLGREDDPARLATLAESMPEPPALEAWADLSDLTLEIQPVTIPEAVVEVAPEPVAEAEAVAGAQPVAEAEAPAEADPSMDADANADEAGSDEDDFPADVIAARLAGLGIAADPADAEPGATVAADGPLNGDWARGPELAPAPAPTPDPAPAFASWGETEGAWSAASGTAAVATAEVQADDAQAAGSDQDDPVDRGAIMAALEAAAEAVVGAEADPEAPLAAGLDAGEFDGSFADRLASLLPGAGADAPVDEPRTTQVIVSGLVSVASIASFKRHLGRLAGVQAVAVASGPEGEFVFNVTHRADASFRDGIPTLPGFAARVTSATDGAVQVTARDPEAEG